MKNLLGIIDLALTLNSPILDEPFEITKRGEVGTSRNLRNLITYSKPKPFIEQEGVVKTIKEFYNVCKGTSKQSPLKQERTLQKVIKWREANLITDEQAEQLDIKYI